MATKKVIEKKTGEKYASKAAMAKHEKGESKTMQKKEVKTFAKKGTPLRQTAKPTKGLVSASKKPAAATTDTKGTAAPKARTLTATPNAIPKGTLLLQKKAPAKMKKC